MTPFTWILATTILISLTAWTGVLLLYLRDDLLDRLLLALVALAAGALIGGAFLHLLPRAVAAVGVDDTDTVFGIAIVGFCTFYVLEQFISWHHHHGTDHDAEPVTYLVLISDAIHNFIDGLVIAASFLAAIPVGIVTTLAIALHEIPQEIGDFGVLVHGGFEKRRALLLNYLTQATVILGGVIGYVAADYVTDIPTIVLPFAAGNFIYIASSDLIPEIKHGEDTVKSVGYFLIFVLGILLMAGIRVFRGAIT